MSDNIIIVGFYFTYNPNTKVYCLNYKDNKIRIPHWFVNTITRSHMAYYWAIQANRDHEEMIPLIDEVQYKIWWIDFFGDKYKIPDDWYVDISVNNV